MIGTMTSAATGSAHHHPTVAFSKRPPRRMAESQVQSAVFVASASSALLPVARATTPRVRSDHALVWRFAPDERLARVKRDVCREEEERPSHDPRVARLPRALLFVQVRVGQQRRAGDDLDDAIEPKPTSAMLAATDQRRAVECLHRHASASTARTAAMRRDRHRSCP